MPCCQICHLILVYCLHTFAHNDNIKCWCQIACCLKILFRTLHSSLWITLAKSIFAFFPHFLNFLHFFLCVWKIENKETSKSIQLINTSYFTESVYFPSSNKLCKEYARNLFFFFQIKYLKLF